MNAPITRAAEGLARRAFTVDEVKRMVEVGLIPPDERFEIVGGEIVPMSPKGARHEMVKATLVLFWGKRCPEDFAFIPETGLYLDKSTYLEPDFIVIDKAVDLSELKGSQVLLAVEVADSSLDYDLRRKPLIYAEYGVRELWVIDAARRSVHVHIGPGPGGYAWIAVRQATERLEPTEAPRSLAFSLDELEQMWIHRPARS